MPGSRPCRRLSRVLGVAAVLLGLLSCAGPQPDAGQLSESTAPPAAAVQPSPTGPILTQTADREAATPDPARQPSSTVVEQLVPSATIVDQLAPSMEPAAGEEQATREALDWALLPSPEPTASPEPTPTPDLRAEHAPAMRPGALDGIAIETMPRYRLRIAVDPAARMLTGSQELFFQNTEAQELGSLVLRLYINFPPDLFEQGNNLHMEVRDVMADGVPATTILLAQETALEIALPRPLPVGSSTTIALNFTANIEPWDDGTWALPFYYPMLAVYEDNAWRLDVTTFPDSVYAESALYQAEISIPSAMVLASTGTTLKTTEAGDTGMTTYSIVTGPAREFAFSLGDFEMTSVSGGAGDDVRVNVYSAASSQFDSAQIAQVTAAALSAFDQRFGAYPYTELDVHLMPGDFDGGDEHPGFILVYSNGAIDAGARYVTAHEVAHQWWYAVVGNDIYHQPWLDEAFAQYSGIIYAEDVEGPESANAHWEREVAGRYAGAIKDGDLPIGWGIDSYPSFNVYYRTVYGKGAVFMRTLREELGDEIFFAALQRYYQEHRYGVGTAADVRRAFEETSGRDLTELFKRWVG